MKNFTRLFFLIAGFCVAGIISVQAQSTTTPSSEESKVVPRAERVYSIEKINANYQHQHKKANRSVRSISQLKTSLQRQQAEGSRKYPQRQVQQLEQSKINKNVKEVRTLSQEVESKVRP